MNGLCVPLHGTTVPTEQAQKTYQMNFVFNLFQTTSLHYYFQPGVKLMDSFPNRITQKTLLSFSR